MRDAPEFKAFEIVMGHVLERARRELAHLSDHKENVRVKRALKEVMQKIQAALAANAEWCPAGLLPVGEPGGSSPAVIPQETGEPSSETSAKAKAERARQEKRKRAKLQQLSPSAMIKKLKVGRQGLALVLDHFGPDQPESFTEGDIIFVNRDHPLYIREAVHRERHIMHVARLIGQEIALMSRPRNAREAFDRQSRLLRDAFVVPPAPTN